MKDTFEEKVIDLLNKRSKDMAEFLNKYVSTRERTRIGDDISRIMPNAIDVATIRLNMLVEEDVKLNV